MTLEPVKIGSTLLQKADLTIGDFLVVGGELGVDLVKLTQIFLRQLSNQ